MGPDKPVASQSQGRLSDWVVSACPDGLWILDDDGRTTFANERMAALLGVSRDAVLGFSAYDVLGETDADTLRQHLAGLCDTAAPAADLELCLRGCDGSRVWVLVSHTRLLDEAGGFQGWLHRVVDHTAQRALLEDFERREQQFAEGQRIARIGSWDWDFDHSRLSWSEELFDIYGVDEASFVPSLESFLDYVHPDDRADVEACFIQALADDQPFAIDFRFGPPARVATWIRARGMAVRDEAGKVVRLRGTSQDVTESKENENSLAFLSAMGRAANEAQTLQDVLIAADAIVRPYAQWPAVVISVPKWRGSETLLHIDIEWEDATDELRQAARELAVRAAAEQRILEELGPTGTVLIGGAVVARGRLACVLVSDTRRSSYANPSDLDVFGQMLTMLSYVAEREWTAMELAAVTDQALSASKAKSEFLATMSHEIRTPLNGVIGLSELLGSTELTPHQRRLADGVDQAGRTLLALVNDILDLSKIEAGRLELEEVDFDPKTVIEQSAALVADQARDKHLELVVSSAGDVPDRVRGDPVRFGQVITNLAANAVKFTATGEVAIRATGAPGTGGTQLRVEVTDTGVGIAPEVEGRLFQAFSQADSSTTREYGGTGLGLAISKRIVTAMGGEIGVESQVGTGSTFWFTVTLGEPLHDGPVRDLIRENAVAGLRVLVVDDNETNRFILTEKLTAWGIEVRAVDSAYEALVELDAAVRRDAPYEIVLLDYMMPGADGEQLARIIRAEPRHGVTRIALLSSAMEPSGEFLSDAGIDAFLSKPVLPANLLETLLTLGCRSTGGDQQSVPLPAAAGTGTRGRILVVEDNPVNQLVAEGVLERMGYTVLLADDGAGGVSAYADDPDGFDAILMDCQMPVMDGYAATRAIRAIPSTGRRIPIIAMTAAAVAEERQRCLDAGMDDFLLKPVDVALLEGTLDLWVPTLTVEPTVVAPSPPPVAEPVTAHEPVQAPAEISTPEPAAAPPADLDVLDRSRLTDLLESGSADLALVFRILDRFGGKASGTATEMATATHDGNPDLVSRLAHSLRGGAANLGLARLAGLCEGIELSAAAGELPAARALFEIEDEIAAGIAELESFARDMVRDAAVSGSPRR